MNFAGILPALSAPVLLIACTGARAHEPATAVVTAPVTLPTATQSAADPATSASSQSATSTVPPIVAPPSSTATPPAVAPTATPAPTMPNAALTPGDVVPSATAQQVCASGYARSVRAVTAEEKRTVYGEYEIDSHMYGSYEIDHLVPLELGGSNDIRNLWPQPALPVPGFHEKDDLENRLRDLVCGGQIGLLEAQQAIATNWVDAYWRFVGGRSP